MPPERLSIAATQNPLLERALLGKFERRRPIAGNLGELEALALRIGLMQNSLKPRLREAQLVVAAGDHGLVVEGIKTWEQQTTQDAVQAILNQHSPVGVLAKSQGMTLNLVDAGMAAPLAIIDRVINHSNGSGTRNARAAAAMTPAESQAAMDAGAQLCAQLRGNVVACVGIGQGSAESAALVLSRLTGIAVAELIGGPIQADSQAGAQLLGVLEATLGRHRQVVAAPDVLATFGGFEIAYLVGLMLAAASKRHVILIDGLTACAALMVAHRLVPNVADYAVFCSSQNHPAIHRALRLFDANPLLELGMDSCDGSGAALAWPLLRSASALLSDMNEPPASAEAEPDLLDNVAPPPQPALAAPTQAVDPDLEWLGVAASWTRSHPVNPRSPARQPAASDLEPFDSALPDDSGFPADSSGF